jgi:hypothetical protein
VNLLGGDIDTSTTKETPEALIEASQEVGREANTEKTKYILMFRHQNAGQNHDIETVNGSIEYGVTFKYLTTVRYQNCIHE